MLCIGSISGLKKWGHKGIFPKNGCQFVKVVQRGVAATWVLKRPCQQEANCSNVFLVDMKSSCKKLHAFDFLTQVAPPVSGKRGSNQFQWDCRGGKPILMEDRVNCE